MRRIDHPLGPEELSPGSVFEVLDRGRLFKVRVPLAQDEPGDGRRSELTIS